jgi:hypothetical protein
MPERFCQTAAGARPGTDPDQLSRCALEDDLTAVVTGARTDVDDVVGMRDDLLIMLDKYE